MTLTRRHEKVTAPCLERGGTAELVQGALSVIDGRWKLAIVFRLFGEPVLRFSELRRSIGEVSHKMLTAHLRELERDGVVRRTVHPTVPPTVEYALTDAGVALRPILGQLRAWALEHRRLLPD